MRNLLRPSLGLSFVCFVLLLLGIIGCSQRELEERHQNSESRSSSTELRVSNESEESREGEQGEESEHGESGERGVTPPDSTGAGVNSQSLPGSTGKCATCHADKVSSTKHVKHGVACESCHRDPAGHLANPETKVKIPAARSDCLLCHGGGGYKGAPQIDGAKHNPKKFCATCHQVHGSSGSGGGERKEGDED